MALARFDVQGKLLGTLADLSQGGGSDLWGHPVVAALDDGSYAAAWTDRFLDGDQLSIALRKVNPDGSLLAPPKVANPLVSFVQKQPDLVWNGSSLVAAWIDESDPFTAPDLHLRLFDANLTPLGEDILLASSEAAEAAVALAALPDSWAAAWRSVVDGQETIEVRTQQGASWSFGPFPALPVEERPALVALDASRLLLSYTLSLAPGTPTQLRLVVLDPSAPEQPSPQPLPGGLAPQTWGQAQPSLMVSGAELFVVWRTGAEPGAPSGQELWIRQLGWEPLSGTLQLTGVDHPLPREKIHRTGDQRHPALSLISGPAPAIAAAWEDVGSGIFEEKNASRVFVQVDPLPFVRINSGGSPEDNATACSNGLDDNDDGLTDCQDPLCMLAGVCQENTLAACSNGYDDNINGLFDCTDPSCYSFCESFLDTCQDGQDNDSNGLIDCADPSCTFQCETSLLTCIDGLDNDDDGVSDCQDQDCINGNFCETTLAGCSDGVDNDGDGAIDCADVQCLAGGFCTENDLVLCHDGLDDDGDGFIDCQDSDCDAFCEISKANCEDGIDNDGDGLIDCFDPECAVQFVCPEGLGLPSTCENGIDDDKDGFIDLKDIGCLNL
jgi:hypothetical protein